MIRQTIKQNQSIQRSCILGTPMHRVKLVVLLTFFISQAHSLSPRDLIESAMEQWRGLSSYSEMTMVIHRPDWERSMSMQAWTKGEKLSLVRVTKPKKDAGNGTLLKEKNMWSYAPKVNRIIKIPSSLMSQGWMGSDFSNKDISKSTDILDSYDHTLTATDERDGHTVYTITSIPHEDAAVVWGKEVVMVRDDFVLLEQQFWDQDGLMVKSMKASDIIEIDGRPVAKVLHMEKVDSNGEWTEMKIDTIDFDVDLKDNLFTLSNLRNPRKH